MYSPLTGFTPDLKGCLLPIRLLASERAFQTLSSSICNRKIEVKSNSDGDISGGGE